ncbi:MAG: hypothetical protein IJV55_00870 [Paludibacteraceae bacterium]|nr:hypothetical protein [Paludibacteraceae bacterium]MBQ9704732.1 hypothetical protein [Paludibacteraceae bacterium]
MKTTKILMLGMVALALAACDKHDPFDDILITGETGPQVYWEIESSAVTAGQSMGFDLQYYTSVPDVQIDRTEVWYNLSETLDKTVSCPWVTTFTYTVTSLTKEEKRVAQKIAAYPHKDYAQWSDSLHAYTFHGTFPVSGTLASYKWDEPAVFEEDKFVSYFGEGFMEHFKDSLYGKMQYADFRSMYLGLGLVDDFQAYTDSTFDVNSDSYVKHFKWNADSTATPVPDEIAQIYKEKVTFADLISGSGKYNVSYKRSYTIRAHARVYDDRGIYGMTVPQDITIN